MNFLPVPDYAEARWQVVYQRSKAPHSEPKTSTPSMTTAALPKSTPKKRATTK